MILSIILSGYLKNVKAKIPQLLVLSSILLGLGLRYGDPHPASSDSRMLGPDTNLVLPGVRQFYPEAVTYRMGADSSHPAPI